MKTLRFLFFLALVTVMASGCSDDESTSPVGTSSEVVGVGIEPAGGVGLVPNDYYSYAWDGLVAYSILESISKQTGLGTVVGNLDYELYTDGATYFGWSPFGLTFDVDGTMYVSYNVMAFDPALVRSQIARVDPATGAVTPIGTPVPFNASGPDIDACGNYYVCGFKVDKLPYIWGNSKLWRVDKATGEYTEVGDTGHTHWMDIAFDAYGTLWGTFDNTLYNIDAATGASSLVTAINGVPDAGPPRHMEVMSIAFDKHNVLYGTCMTVEYDDPNGSPVLRIDVTSGDATVVGYTHQPYNHGGDILPAQVRVAHQTASGNIRCLTVAMDALSSHLAHGDYVPGTNGRPCGCEDGAGREIGH